MPLFGPPDVCKLRNKRDVKGLINALRYQKDSYVRGAAAEALGEIGDARAVRPLIAALKDRDVHGWVINALGLIGDARAVKPLIAEIDGDGRENVATALGKIGAPAVESLLAVLQDSRKEVRQAASRALGEIGDVRAVEPLIALLCDEDEDEKLRKSATAALGKIGDARAVEPLIAVLKDRTYRVHDEAEYALGQIGAPAVESLLTMLKDSNREVRRAAARTLGRTGDVRAVELLIALLQDQELRRAAIFGLGHMGDARAVEPLIAVLRDADSIVREFAARALGQIGDARAVEPLIVALEDNAATVVEAATMALNSLGVPRGVQAARDAFLQRQEQASQTQQRRVDATEQVVTELCALLRSEKGSDFPHESTIQRARAIGEQLNQHGGFERMQRVMKVVIDQMPFDYQRLDYWWDGIGQWRW